MGSDCQLLLWSLLLVWFGFIYPFSDHWNFPLIPGSLNSHILGSRDCSLDSSCEITFDCTGCFLVWEREGKHFWSSLFSLIMLKLDVLEPSSSLSPVKVQGRNQTPTPELVLEDVADHPATNHATTSLVLFSHDSLRPRVWGSVPPLPLPWKRFSQTALVLSWNIGEIMSLIPFLRKFEWHTVPCGTNIYSLA